MKNKNFEFKKFLHFLIVILMLLALLFGIIFSSIETNKGIKLGSQYRGSYQAVVGVYDANKTTNDDQDNEGLPNGDAKTGAEVLQNKLSPFADGSVNVTINGKSRLIVNAPRDSYSNNQKLFVNAIQSTGGLFIFDDQNTDVMLDSTLMSNAGLNASLDQKSATSELLGNVLQVSKQLGMTNKPFLKFDLKNDAFIQMNQSGDANDSNSKAPDLKMVVDVATLLDTFRNYFLFASSDQLDTYLDNFLKGVIQPLQSSQTIKGNDIQILRDFFTITYWKTTNNDDVWTPDTKSLIDPDFIGNVGVDEFKKILFADNNPDHQFKYTNDISKYVYDSNSVGKDFTETDGKYYKPLKIDGLSEGIKINEVFNSLTKNLFPLLLDNNKTNPAGINELYFDQDLFSDFFIFSNSVNTGSNLPSENEGSIIDHEFYIGTKTYTIAKKAAAQISQTATGMVFHVFSVSEVNAVISNVMFIFSIVALLIIGIAILIFILFFYRLLGLFTIIIAAIIASLTLLMNVVFGIAMGPEIIAIMFVLIGLIMDISVVMFESFKNNIFLEKRPLLSSFNISNRETLGLVIDVLLASLLPNIVLFWIGIGFLKNFATILTMGVLFTFIFGVIVLRIMVYSTVRTPLLKRYSWLLPVDTSLEYDGRFIYHYLILLKQEKLESYTDETQLSAQELLKIKKLEEKIRVLQIKNQVFIDKKKKKKLNHQIWLEKKWKKQLSVLKSKKNKIDKKKHFSDFLINHYDKKIDYLNYLLNVQEIHDDENGAVLNDRLTRIEKNTTKVGSIVLLFTIFCTILALILSFTLGLNYSINFGKGTQYYVYGTYVSATYDKLAAADTIPGIADSPDREQIVKDLNDIRNESKNFVLSDHGLTNDSPTDQINKYQNEWESLGVFRAYKYLISHNYLQYLTTSVKGIEFKNVTYSYGSNYSMIDPTNSSFVNKPWIALVTTNNLIPNNNAIKTAFQIFAGQYSGTNRPLPPKNDGGILGMMLEPHTASTQMKQIGITLGIVLLALLIYMLIRFKWTYYIALALGLIVTLALTISLVIVLRIPFSIEALAGILGVLGFALITGMLFLGRGKSIIISKDEKNLNDFFEQEIKLQAQKKHLKLELKNKLRTMKKEKTQELKKLDRKAENYRQEKKKINQIYYQELKKLKSTEKLNLKIKFKEINAQINLEARKNNFLKEIFANVLKFGILRTIFLSSFYLVIGLITAITMPSIGIMGFTLMIGVIASTLVMMTIVLPVWIQLERRRIRMKYGYKKFVNNLQVTNEEQIIANLND